MITKVVKVTHTQMQALLDGETVAGHVYDPTHCLYIEDTGAELPMESGSFVLTSNDDGRTFSYTHATGGSIVDFDGEDIAGLYATVSENPTTLFRYDGCIYSPVYWENSTPVPNYYASMQADENECYVCIFDWEEETCATSAMSVLTPSVARSTYLPIQIHEVDAVTRPIPAQGPNHVVYHITAPEITELTSGLTVRVHKPLMSAFPNDSEGAIKLLQINNLTPIALFWKYNTMITWNRLDNVYMTLTYAPNARPNATDYYGYTRVDGFLLDFTYDSGNDVYNLYDYGPYQTGALGLSDYCIAGWDINGKRIPIIQSNGTLNTATPFVIQHGISYYDGGTRSANTSYSTWQGNFWLRKETAYFQAAFLAACGLSSVTTTTKVYLKCTLSGITATPVSVTTSLPSSEDGYYYIHLMHAYEPYSGTSAARYWTFDILHPIYCYRGGQLIEVTNNLEASSAGNAAAGKIVSRNANGTIQSEKIALSSGTTTKATMQYNSTDDCVEFIFA